MKALVLIAAASLSTAASAFDGAWTAARDEERRDRIYVQMTRGRAHHMGTTMSLDAFTGLDEAQVDAATETPVRFAMNREAGDTTFQGSFRKGKGAGQFTFTPRPAFLETVRALGVDVDRGKHGKGSDREEMLFALAVNDVTVAFIQSMIAEGYLVGLDKYLALRIFDVTPEFIREMRDLDESRVRPTVDEVIALRAGGVTPEYLASMRALFPKVSLKEASNLGVIGVTADWVRDMGAAGIRLQSGPEASGLRALGVTPALVLRLGEAGCRDLSVSELQRLAAFGGTPPQCPSRSPRRILLL